MDESDASFRCVRNSCARNYLYEYSTNVKRWQAQKAGRGRNAAA